MKKTFPYLSLILTLSLSLLSAPPTRAAGKESQSRSSAGMTLAMVSPLKQQNATDGQVFIDKMYASADAYDDYVFEFEMTAFKHGKVVEAGRFYFKKPKLIRLEETGSFRRGSVAVLGRDGKVKAKAGGGLGFFVIDLAPNSGMLRSANGHPMVESDLTSLAQALKIFLQEGKVARVSAEPISFGQTGDRVHVLEIFHDRAMSDIYKRVAVHPKTMLPVEWWDFEEGKLVSHSRWMSFRGNLGLAEEVFTIKGAKVQ
ncbi:MAG TPA: hypothetical protein PKN86_09945 [Candidatus Obscuribacter sp.]|nr:hypothetical protein [Candidatus Obscuribacter sp.]HMW89082.1 hypothetical protein [Candidatus Obscuribacter sp.]HMX44646.1 hypothetical protein [Candidatus Obscuribacter sp.]HMY54908.1 hypothetical protein [Candidatus Obscuribacter sp.]HNB15195.1 hypothetical protein [Candidatus Obscuribacter sp.]